MRSRAHQQPARHLASRSRCRACPGAGAARRAAWCRAGAPCPRTATLSTRARVAPSPSPEGPLRLSCAVLQPPVSTELREAPSMVRPRRVSQSRRPEPRPPTQGALPDPLARSRCSRSSAASTAACLTRNVSRSRRIAASSCASSPRRFSRPADAFAVAASNVFLASSSVFCSAGSRGSIACSTLSAAATFSFASDTASTSICPRLRASLATESAT